MSQQDSLQSETNCFCSRCLIPWFDGAVLSQECKEALWDKLVTTAYSRHMRFNMIFEANGIEHRLTKPNHPWTNGQVERMNHTIKEATVKRFHSVSHHPAGGWFPGPLSPTLPTTRPWGQPVRHPRPFWRIGLTSRCRTDGGS